MNRRTVLSLHSKQELFAAKDLDVLTFNGRPAAKAKNRQYAELFRDYKDFFCKIIKDRNIINRSFYLAIREEPLIGLDIQASLCMDKLKAMNITLA